MRENQPPQGLSPDTQRLVDQLKITDAARAVGLEPVMAFVPSAETKAKKRGYMAEKKAQQRERDQAQGLVQITLKVPAEKAQQLKQEARQLVDPSNPTRKAAKRRGGPLRGALWAVAGLVVGFVVGLAI